MVNVAARPNHQTRCRASEIHITGALMVPIKSLSFSLSLSKKKKKMFSCKFSFFSYRIIVKKLLMK